MHNGLALPSRLSALLDPSPHADPLHPVHFTVKKGISVGLALPFFLELARGDIEAARSTRVSDVPLYTQSLIDEVEARDFIKVGWFFSLIPLLSLPFSAFCEHDQQACSTLHWIPVSCLPTPTLFCFFRLNSQHKNMF